MTSSEFKTDRYYSRFNYGRGLVVTRTINGQYYYISNNGKQYDKVRGGSSVHKLDDFYESDRLGYKLDTNIDEHIAKKKAMYDEHRMPHTLWLGKDTVFTRATDGFSPNKYRTEARYRIKGQLGTYTIAYDKRSGVYTTEDSSEVHTSLERATIAQRDSLAMMLTPSGKSTFFEEYKRSIDKARKIKLTKVDKMGRFENDSSTVAEMANGVKNETIEIAQITIGKMIYVNSTELIARFVPKLKWYEKLLTSKKKREIIVMIGTYVAIKAVQTKYDHYLLQSITSYINYQLQTELIGGMTQETLDKIFSRFEKVED